MDRLVRTIIFAAVCGSAVVVAAQAQEAPRGDAANGKRLYLANYCYTCHGRVGQGGAYNGPAPALAKTAMPYEGLVGQNSQPVERHARLFRASSARSGACGYLCLLAVVARSVRPEGCCTAEGLTPRPTRPVSLLERIGATHASPLSDQG